MLYQAFYRGAALLAVGFFAVGAASASAAVVAVPPSTMNYRLTHPENWGNTTENEQPPVGNPNSGTVNGDSWQSNPTATSTGGQHLIYFQGGINSQNESAANPANGDNPQLLFDGSATSVKMSDIQSLSWDDNRASISTSNAHWFFQITTANESGGYYGHNLTFALTDDSAYTEDAWNTLKSDKNDSLAPSGLDLVLYDQNRIKAGNQGDSEDDRTEFPAKTLAQWADDALSGDEPDWWSEEILYAAMGTGTNYNSGNSTFIDSLDNFQFSYAKGDNGINTVNIDLGVPGNDVPEPNTLWFFGLAILASLGLALRRRDTRI